MVMFLLTVVGTPFSVYVAETVTGISLTTLAALNRPAGEILAKPEFTLQVGATGCTEPSL